MVIEGEAALPPDLFHLLCQQLSNIADFATLYSLVVSSKVIANAGAVAALYRISHESPVKGGGSEVLSLAEQGLYVQKWSILWRTVIASALGTTIYPYCRYLRMLDLRDLSHLLDDDKFRDKISKQFFSSELARFRIVDTAFKTRAQRLDTKKIVRAVGDEIIPISPFLEAICEPPLTNVLSTALLDWAPKLTGLRQLDLFDGQALTDEKLRDLIHTNCSRLEVLKIYNMRNPSADDALAQFFDGMQLNQLKYFENNSDCGISTKTCKSLNRHCKSLHTLKLALSDEGVLAIAMLQECTALRTLSIACDTATPDLKATQHDVFVQIQEWLKRCKALKDVTFVNILSAPDLMTPVLLDDAISIEKLDINSPREDALYVMKDNHEFHRALGQHSSLRLLHLGADPDMSTRDDVEILLQTLCSLENLNDLRLSRVSDYFTDKHINILAQSLPELEELFIGGYGVSDAVWNGMCHLKKLKTLNFFGITSFTTAGIVDFIDQLGPENKGLTLSVDNAEPDKALSMEEQDLLRDLIAVKVEGKFEYQLSRDINLIDFGDSDDSD